MTLSETEQFCPAILNVKNAVPEIPGVPVMLQTSEPEPLAKLPALKVAVRPVTPVDATTCVL
jgi:hypothetical protein